MLGECEAVVSIGSGIGVVVADLRGHRRQWVCAIGMARPGGLQMVLGHLSACRCVRGCAGSSRFLRSGRYAAAAAADAAAAIVAGRRRHRIAHGAAEPLGAVAARAN